MESGLDANIAADSGAPVATADRPEKMQRALTFQQRRELGRAARQRTPRSSHAAWAPARERPDPVDLLEAQAQTREPELLRIRYALMTPSPFTFMRGAAITMAHDLAGTPRTGIRAQLCGDCHLLDRKSTRLNSSHA